MKHLVIACGLLVLAACTNAQDARDALANQGFTDVEVTGWRPFTCGKDDFYATGFRARNAQGRVVEGTVCSGLLFKGSTVRW